MSAILVMGSNRPVETKRQIDVKERKSVIIEVEGLYSALERENPENYCPSGMAVESSSVTSSGDGFGKMSIRCIEYEVSGQSSPMRTTFSIKMESVQYDLKDHPHLSAQKDIILKWLATDESERSTSSGYFYRNEDDELVKIESDAVAHKFCVAYMNGITSFNRYYPVIEKISTWKNPPGLNRNGKTFTGGTVTFSNEIGSYDDPPLSLSGYPLTNWFKSCDEWSENADKTWNRSESWTYTPEGRNGLHAWIYNSLRP